MRETLRKACLEKVAQRMPSPHAEATLKLLDETEWASVEDRLPKENRYVIVYRNGSVTVAYCFRGEFWQAHRLAGVTHWMPLPEPPQ